MPLVSEAEARFDALRRRVGLWLGPLVFVLVWVLPFETLTPQAHRLAAVASLCVVLWVTEAIPLAATALLGPALAALLGVATASVAFAPLADPLIFLFLGGFLLAAGLSAQRFDQRAALWLIARPLVAGSPMRALIVIACIAFGFSMWLSNTATTAMLLPVALGLHVTMREALRGDENVQRRLDHFGGGMCLCMAYASSLGGVATPIGTGPNVIAVGLLETEMGQRIDFVDWMRFALPTALAMLIAMLLVASRVFKPPVATISGLTTEIERQLQVLGPVQQGERRAVGVFALAVAGWLLPSLLRYTVGLEHAWAQQIVSVLDEGVVAIVAASLLFFVSDGRRQSERAPLLSWDHAQNLDWGTILLLGGGLSLGKLTFTTGLADAIGRGVLEGAGSVAAHPLGLTAVAVLLVIFLTEVTSNTATTAMMLPVLIGIAKAGDLDPTPTAIGVTLAASFAFMLPVSTPPNAMAYGTRLIRIGTMMKMGLWLDILGYMVLMALVYTLL